MELKLDYLERVMLAIEVDLVEISIYLYQLKNIRFFKDPKKSYIINYQYQ